jgi:hypothetical protein
MTFVHRGTVPGWARLEEMGMYSCNLKSAESELQYVGLEIGRSGLIVIEGGKK